VIAMAGGITNAGQSPETIGFLVKQTGNTVCRHVALTATVKAPCDPRLQMYELETLCNGAGNYGQPYWHNCFAQGTKCFAAEEILLLSAWELLDLN
jgi:hypothetical protein